MTGVASEVAGSEEGSALQWQIPSAAHNLVGPVPNGGNILSPVIPAPGWQKGAVGLTSTQAGQISVQRYIDAAGTVPVGAPLTAALVATVANWVSWQDGVPYGSFRITVTNTGGAPATLTNVAVLLQTG